MMFQMALARLNEKKNLLPIHAAISRSIFTIEQLIPAFILYRNVHYFRTNEEYDIRLPINMVVSIIYHNIAFYNIFKYIDIEEEDNHIELYEKSFHLVSMFQRNYGQEGFAAIKDRVMCGTCPRTMTNGDDCTYCCPVRVTSEEMTYRSHFCKCIWKKGQNNIFCSMCAADGATGNLYFEYLRLDIPFLSILISVYYVMLP